MAQEQVVKVAWEVHQRILEASRNMTTNRWEVAHGLSEIVRIRGWREMGHDTFEEYVDKEVPVALRTAQALVRAYEKLDALEVPIDSIADIGWTKIDVLVPVLNHDNVEYWLDQAREQGVRALEERVKAELHPERVKQAENTPVTRRFNLDTGQASVIEEALSTCKAVTGAGGDAESLTLICSGFLEEQGKLPLDEHLMLLERRHNVVLHVTHTEGVTEGNITNEKATEIFEHGDSGPQDTNPATPATVGQHTVDEIFGSDGK